MSTDYRCKQYSVDGPFAEEVGWRMQPCPSPDATPSQDAGIRTGSISSREIKSDDARSVLGRSVRQPGSGCGAFQHSWVRELEARGDHSSRDRGAGPESLTLTLFSCSVEGYDGVCGEEAGGNEVGEGARSASAVVHAPPRRRRPRGSGGACAMARLQYTGIVDDSRLPR